MEVFIVGMRRSGTTILFDCLDEDGRLQLRTSVKGEKTYQ